MSMRPSEVSAYRLVRFTDHKFEMFVRDARGAEGSLGEYASPEQAMRHLGWWLGRDDLPESCDFVDYKNSERIVATPISVVRRRVVELAGR